MILPKNVKFKLEEYCDGCELMDLELEKKNLYSEDKLVMCLHTISCKNDPVCRKAREECAKENSRKYPAV